MCYANTRSLMTLKNALWLFTQEMSEEKVIDTKVHSRIRFCLRNDLVSIYTILKRYALLYI